MESLLGLVLAVVAVLFGVDLLQRKKERAHVRKARALDERQTREAAQDAQADAEVAALETKIKERNDAEKPAKASPSDAAARLRQRFGRRAL